MYAQCALQRISVDFMDFSKQQAASPFPIILQAHVNIFRNQAQYERTCIVFGHVAFLQVFSSAVG